jgi:hypothetical protein
MQGRTPYKDEKRKAVFEIMDKFPDANTRALARIVYRDLPEYFSDCEAARCYIRSYRGQHGIACRKTYTITKYYKNVPVA